jgi:hypothetical protein
VRLVAEEDRPDHHGVCLFGAVGGCAEEEEEEEDFSGEVACGYLSLSGHPEGSLT